MAALSVPVAVKDWAAPLARVTLAAGVAMAAVTLLAGVADQWATRALASTLPRPVAWS